MHSTTITQQQVDASPAMQAAFDKVKLGKVNGVSHELTCAAFNILRSDLEGYGNVLGDMQQEALLELVGTMTKYAQGVATGRKAFNLATGCGKTSAIISWIVAVHRLGLDHVSIAVAASRVDALCNIKKALLKHGVPEEVIGLKYSDGIVADYPSTGNGDRRVMLVTHSRVRGDGRNDELFTMHNGIPRCVMIYDESLFKSDTMAVADKSLRVALAILREEVRDAAADYSGLIGYLERCSEAITGALVEARKGTVGSEVMLTLPQVLPIQLKGYMALLGQRSAYEPLREILRLSEFELRVVSGEQGGGVVFYALRIPPELSNVLVLDASYPVRKLLQLDTSMACDSKYAHQEVKRFDRLTIHQMLGFGGRHSVMQSFGRQHRDKRDISKEVIAVMQSKLNSGGGTLVFTFKSRPYDGIDVTKVLKQDMAAADLDPAGLLPNGKSRYCFLTYGDECGRNDVSHCSTVIMAGILHRAHLELTAAIAGQEENLKTRVDHKLVLEMLNSEIDHVFYQGLSRGCCRITNHGQATKQDVYLIHKDLGMRKRLAGVLPGATWKLWEPRFKKAEAEGIIARAALRILEALSQVPTSVTKMPTRALKADHGLHDMEPKTFTRALAVVMDSTFEWLLVGRSVVRSGFTGT